jgi:hypothetical protein
MPGRDIARISLHDIVTVVRTGGVTGSYRDPVWSGGIDVLGAQIDSAIAGAVADRTLASLLDETAPAAGD